MYIYMLPHSPAIHPSPYASCQARRYPQCTSVVVNHILIGVRSQRGSTGAPLFCPIASVSVSKEGKRRGYIVLGVAILQYLLKRPCCWRMYCSGHVSNTRINSALSAYTPMSTGPMGVHQAWCIVT